MKKRKKQQGLEREETGGRRRNRGSGLWQRVRFWEEHNYSKKDKGETFRFEELRHLFSQDCKMSVGCLLGNVPLGQEEHRPPTEGAPTAGYRKEESREGAMGTAALHQWPPVSSDSSVECLNRCLWYTIWNLEKFPKLVIRFVSGKTLFFLLKTLVTRLFGIGLLLFV